MSSRPHFRSILLTAVAGVAVAACSDNATGPSPQTLDLATLLGEMSPASVSAATTFAMSAAGPMLVVTSPFDPTQCVYSAETGFFVCPTRTLNGVAVTRMYRLIDAAAEWTAPEAEVVGQREAMALVQRPIHAPESRIGDRLSIETRIALPPSSAAPGSGSSSTSSVSSLRATQTTSSAPPPRSSTSSSPCSISPSACWSESATSRIANTS